MSRLCTVLICNVIPSLRRGRSATGTTGNYNLQLASVAPPTTRNAEAPSFPMNLEDRDRGLSCTLDRGGATRGSYLVAPALTLGYESTSEPRSEWIANGACGSQTSRRERVTEPWRWRSLGDKYARYHEEGASYVPVANAPSGYLAIIGAISIME